LRKLLGVKTFGFEQSLKIIIWLRYKKAVSLIKLMVKFREFTLKSGREIRLGKDSESNDELVRCSKKEDLMLHTESPGSPFCNVGEDVSDSEVNEAAVVCAKYSQDWRDNKQDVVVNKFYRRDMKKGVFMKSGTWSVKKQEKIKVKKVDILRFEEALSFGD